MPLAIVFAAALAASPTPAPCPLPTPGLAVQPFRPSREQRAAIVATMKTPQVLAIRTAFDDAAAGRPNAPNAARALRGYPAALLRDRFAVMDVSDGIMGGEWYALFFAHHRTALYDVWMYRLGANGPWELRAFAPRNCSADQMRFVDERYGELFDSLPGG